jgi:hypothetical protein
MTGRMERAVTRRIFQALPNAQFLSRQTDEWTDGHHVCFN